MTENEIKLLRCELAHAETYLEFGSGNSTRIAAELPHLRRITVVESDDTFFRTQVVTTPAVRDAIGSGRLEYLYINIGETGEWGYPLTAERADAWPEYHAKAFRAKENYDLILVDGRFRIACILQACLRCGRKTRILVRDFFNRPSYFVVLPFLNCLRRVDTFGLFKPDLRRIKRNRTLIKDYIGVFQYYPGL